MSEIVVLPGPFHGTDRDLAVLMGLPNVQVTKLWPDQYFKGTRRAKLLILPGSARTNDDLCAFRSAGGEELVRDHLSKGGFVFGLCGGMQFLCEWLIDPLMTEGSEQIVRGLGLIEDSRTVFGPHMISTQTTAVQLESGEAFSGVEHRSGYTTFNYGRNYSPLATIVERNFDEPKPEPVEFTLNGDTHPISSHWAPGTEALDGMVSNDHHIWASYIHLILTNPSVLSVLLPIVMA